MIVARRGLPILRRLLRFYSTPKKESDEFVQEKNAFVNTQDVLNEVLFHPKRQVPEYQQRLQDPNFQIPGELKELNHDMARLELNKDLNIPNAVFSPTEHTLMRLLFGNLIEEVKDELPRLTRSYMQDDFNFDVKPLRDVEKALSGYKIKSNILKLRRRDSLLIKSDFQRVFPPKLERQYDCQHMDFDLVHGRNPKTLESIDIIYLIFQDHLHAGCYFLETMHKPLNGLNLKFEFADPVREYLFIKSPLLPDLKPPQYLQLYENKEASMDNLSDFLEQTKINANIEPLTEIDSGKLFNHVLMSEQKAKTKSFQRSQACIMQRVPHHVTVSEIEDVLWDYNLYDLDSSSIRPLGNQQWLVIFASQADRDRCIRQFNNRRWYNNNSKMPVTQVEIF